MKKKLIYIIPLVDRIGEIATQTWRLRQIFDTEKYDTTVITYPLEHKPRTNKAFYNIAVRDLNVLHADNKDLFEFDFTTKKFPFIVKDSDFEYSFISSYSPIIGFKLHSQQKPDFYFKLTDFENQKGEQLMDKMGIPRTAKIVTLHVRESGYLRMYSYHDYRNADVANYIPAIQYLIDHGYYVIRIGDKSMKRIVNAPHQFIDAPFHSDYSELVDPFFISKSKFLITCPSGPLTVAWGFNISVLMTDCIIPTGFSPQKDISIYKKLYSKKLKRNLTYEEVLMSPITDYYRTEFYKDAGIELIDNTPEEILMATKEMINIDNYQMMRRSIDNKVKEIHQKAFEIREDFNFIKDYRSPNGEDLSTNIWLLNLLLLSKAQIGFEFIKLNPYFLN